jgi:cell division protein FtsQ
VSRAATTRDRSRSPRRGRSKAAPGGAAVTSLRSRRRRAVRRADPRRRLLDAAAVLLAVVTVGAWVVYASPLLAVRTVQVDGVGSLTDAQVEQVAGIEAGTPLMRVDTGTAAARIAQIPQVASVEVTRGWPHTVVVTLVERVPVAIVDRAGTRSLVDRDGVLFDTITGAVPADVVPLTVPRPGPDDVTTAAALGAVVALPADVRREVTGVTAGSPDDVTLTLTDGRTVLWGSAEATPRKARVLAALLAQIEAGSLDQADTLDVSTPDAVVLR